MSRLKLRPTNILYFSGPVSGKTDAPAGEKVPPALFFQMVLLKC